MVPGGLSGQSLSCSCVMFEACFNNAWKVDMVVYFEIVEIKCYKNIFVILIEKNLFEDDFKHWHSIKIPTKYSFYSCERLN